MKGWLDKYNVNANEGHSSAQENWEGEGYSNVGRDYSPAWGGQFAMGGSLPGSVGFMYARTQGAAPSNGPYAKKTKASAQKGDKIPIDLTKDSRYAEPISEATQFMKDWMNSPMYEKMLRESVNKDKAYDYIKTARENRMGDGNISYYEDSLDPGLAAITHTSPSSPKSKMYFNKDTYDSDLSYLAAHELSHVSDVGGLLIPREDVRLMSDYATHDVKNSDMYEKAKEKDRVKELSGFIRDLNQPTETRARLTGLRKISLDQGLYDPFTQPFNLDMLKKYKQLEVPEGGFITDPYYQLRLSYTDEEIADMMNKISKTDNKEILPIAQKGKEITYTHEPGQRGAYRLQRTVTPYTSNRDIRRFTETPTDPRQVNFLQNYAGAISGYQDDPGFNYPTQVPYEGAKHWNIDKFVIDPQFGGRTGSLHTTESTAEQNRANTLADMYKYYMLQDPEHKRRDFRKAKRFVRNEVDSRIEGPFLQSYNTVGTENPDRFQTEDQGFDTYANENKLKNLYWSQMTSNDNKQVTPEEIDKLKNVSMDYFRNYKKMSKKEAKDQWKNWEEDAANFQKTGTLANGGSMSYYQHGLDWKPKSISKNGGWLDKYTPQAQTGYTFPSYQMPINKTDTPGGISIQEKQKQDAIAEEIRKRNVATNKRQFVGQGKASTPASEARRKRLNQQYASQQPNAKIDEQTGEVSRVNPDRSVTGTAENFMSRREDKAGEHALGALEAASVIVPAIDLAGAGYGALRNTLGESIESGALSKVNKFIKPPAPTDLGEPIISKKMFSKYNSKTGAKDFYNVDIADRLVPGRSFEDVSHKMGNLRKDLGINRVEDFLYKRFPKLGPRIPLDQGKGMLFDPETGHLFDSNTRYWLNRQYGHTPSIEGLIQPREGYIAETYGNKIFSQLPLNKSSLFGNNEMLTNPKQYFTKPSGGPTYTPNYENISRATSEGSDPLAETLNFGTYNQAPRVLDWNKVGQTAAGVGIGSGLVSGALKQKKKGGVIEDDRGQWAHPGKITKINSNQITMKGVPYPVLGISDSGDKQMMYPEQEYTFKGKTVTEYPQKKKNGGWLEKYN